jgi:hypothetical protein
MQLYCYKPTIRRIEDDIGYSTSNIDFTNVPLNMLNNYHPNLQSEHQCHVVFLQTNDLLGDNSYIAVQFYQMMTLFIGILSYILTDVNSLHDINSRVS